MGKVWKDNGQLLVWRENIRHGKSCGNSYLIFHTNVKDKAMKRRIVTECDEMSQAVIALLCLSYLLFGDPGVAWQCIDGKEIKKTKLQQSSTIDVLIASALAKSISKAFDWEICSAADAATGLDFPPPRCSEVIKRSEENCFPLPQEVAAKLRNKETLQGMENLATPAMP